MFKPTGTQTEAEIAEFLNPDTLIRNARRHLVERYEIRETQFQTHSGLFCEAHDIIEDRSLTLKLFPEILANDKASLDALRKEVSTSLRLSHPGIVRVFPLEIRDRLAFIPMNYLDGTPLEHRLDSSFRRTELQSIYEQSIAALAYAHRKGVVHADLRPSTILLDGNNRVLLVDFGVSKLVADTMTRTTGRTPRMAHLFTAPEVIRGERCTEASDYYAIACVLYQLLTGDPPFLSGDLAHQHLHETPEPLPSSLFRRNQEICTFVTVGLTKDPQQRLKEVSAVTGRLMTDVRTPTQPGKHRRRRRFRGKRLFRAGLITLICAAVAFALGLAGMKVWWVAHNRDTLNKLDLDFQPVPSGSFYMGQRAEAGGQDNPRHEVEITYEYEIGAKEISLAQYLSYLNEMRATPEGIPNVSGSEGAYQAQQSRATDLPVTGMGWTGASEFCKWLSRIDPRWDYGLPTEAEWEKAARSSRRDLPYPWGDLPPGTENGSQMACSGTNRLLRVGEEGYRQNAVSFHFLGNAAELVSDFYDAGFYLAPEAGEDPKGPSSGTERVVRGGSWGDEADRCRVGVRSRESDYETQTDRIGFRVVRREKQRRRN